jgi:predicted alpha/beta hydrolase
MTESISRAPETATLSVLPVMAADGARAELQLVEPEAGKASRLLFWLPAMGVPARSYLPLARELAGLGIAVALHEWRGIGSSDRRAGWRSDWGYRELLACDLPASFASARKALPHAACLIGGHSLGGQLASVFASIHQDFDAVALVASGAPYWRTFPHRRRIYAAYAAAPLLAAAAGHLPGRRIGFGGNEARGVIADWSRSGRSGRYAAEGLDADLEAALATQRKPVLGLRFRDDWLVPASSLAWLLDKMPAAPRTLRVVSPADPGNPVADHFAWMKTPGAVAAAIVGWLDDDVRAVPRASRQGLP